MALVVHIPLVKLHESLALQEQLVRQKKWSILVLQDTKEFLPENGHATILTELVKHANRALHVQPMNAQRTATVKLSATCS